MKKVVICSSRIFQKQAQQWKQKLEKLGYNVIKIPILADQNSLEEYKNAHTSHYKKIVETDILLVLNIEKNNIPNYVGPSVFAEIAFAIGLNIAFEKNIQIYCINDLPENSHYAEELKLWKKLNWIKIRKDK